MNLVSSDYDGPGSTLVNLDCIDYDGPGSTLLNLELY